MVKTRSGKRTEISITPKKTKRVKRTWTHLYVVNTQPLTVSLTRKNKYDLPNKSYAHVVVPGTTLYVAAQKYCNAKWYNNYRVRKSWIYDVFLTRDACEDWIKNYTCGEDKWIETSEIIETQLHD